MSRRRIYEIANGPTYIFDKEKFIDNYAKIRTCFKEYYDKFNIGYSYKTNYAPCICKLVDELGGYAEVVSPFEVCHAMEMIDWKKNIIFNGVCKEDETLRELKINGSIINCDSLEDVQRMISIGGALSGRPDIGIRLNFDIGNGLTSRFGIEYGSNDYNKIIKLNKDGRIRIRGIHCHISKARDIESWIKRTDKMIEVAKEIGQIEYIDLGGNMYSEMEEFLAKQYGDDLPTMKDYAREIGSRFAKAFPDKEKRPEMILETGTPLVANTMSVLSKVKAIKKIQDKTFVILDTSKYDLGFISEVKEVPIEVYKREELDNEEDTEYVLTGYTCIEDDTLRRNYKGKLRVGDLVEFKNVGAYSNNLSPTFIMPSLPMIEVSNRGCEIIKETISYRDVMKGQGYKL